MVSAGRGVAAVDEDRLTGDIVRRAAREKERRTPQVRQRAVSLTTGAVSSVAKKPGAIALAFTPCRDHASACARVSWAIAPFDAPYGAQSANARTDCSEAMLMMRPQPRAIIAGARRWARKNGASRFSLIVASQSSSVTSRIDFRRLVPAADTSISGAPKDSPARAAHSLSEARSARSQGR